jgi:anti-sigma factor RsiW
MKTCGFEKQIDLYLDNELSGAELRSFEAHLQACPECRKQVEQTRGMLLKLRGMAEREAPAMLSDRLHAALSNEIVKGDGRVKRKFKPWALTSVSAAALVVLVITGVLLFGNTDNHAPNLMSPAGVAGAGVASSDAQKTLTSGANTGEAAAPEATAAPAAAVRYQGFAQSGATADNPAQAANGRKIIYAGYITEETREFDKSMAGVDALLAKYGGYVQSSQINGVPEGSGDTLGRTAVITLRLPIDKYGSAMEELQGMGNLLSKNENTDDVSRQYVDTDARNKTLIAQRDRYMALLDKADNTESIIALQNQITELTVQIEQNTAQLRFWDDQVSYSAITVEFHELVIPKSVEPSNPDLNERANGAFYKTLNAMKKGLEDFAVWFVGFLPWLAIIVAVGGIAAAIAVPVTRKARKAARKAAEAKKKEE